MLFLGEEWGAPEPFLYFADWDGDLREAVREGRKREFGHVTKSSTRQPRPARSVQRGRPSTPAGPIRPSEGQRSRQAWLAMVRARSPRAAAGSRRATPQLLTGQHTAQRIGERGLAVQWRYADGQMLALDSTWARSRCRPAAAPGPVEAQDVFRHRWPADTPRGTWPAWAARWTHGPEITL
jgi:maltooligosyltrehalose trehalohydrolase